MFGGFSAFSYLTLVFSNFLDSFIYFPLVLSTQSFLVGKAEEIFDMLAGLFIFLVVVFGLNSCQALLPRQ